MATNFVKPGKVITLTAPEGGVVSGGTYKIGSLIVVALSSADAEAEFEAATEGVFTIVKNTSETWTEGEKVYFDASEAEWTEVAAAGNYLGGVAFAAGSSATSAQVWLSQAAGSTAQAAVVAALAGTLTGTTDGTLADVAAVSTAGGNTYADSAINTAITAVNLQLKEIQTTLNAVIAAMKAADLMASA